MRYLFQLVFLIVCCCASGQLAAQTLYLQDGTRLVRKSAVDCSTYGVVTELYAEDIGFESGVMYAITGTKLFTVDLVTGEQNVIFEAGSNYDQGMNGLTGDGNGHLYISGDSISRYTIATGQMEVLGSTADEASGDLVYKNGKLYVAVTHDGHPYLLKIVVATFAQILVGELPMSASGLAVMDNSNEDIYVAQYTSLGKISMADAMYTPVCNNITLSYISGMTMVPENLGLPEAEAFSVSVYPNPASGSVRIDLESADAAAAELLDLSGKILKTQPFTGISCELSLQGVSAGTYLVRVSGEHGTVYRKVQVL